MLKYEKRPDRDELSAFYCNRYVEARKRSTLPFLTEQWIQDFLKAYALSSGNGPLPKS